MIHISYLAINTNLGHHAGEEIQGLTGLKENQERSLGRRKTRSAHKFIYIRYTFIGNPEVEFTRNKTYTSNKML